MFDRILVTGARGRIAGYVIDDLKDRCRLMLTDHTARQSPFAIAQVDVCDLAALKGFVKGQDAIVHLAAVSGRESMDDMLSVNVRGTWNVLAMAEEYAIRKVIIMSSEAGLGMGLSLSKTRFERSGGGGHRPWAGQRSGQSAR